MNQDTAKDVFAIERLHHFCEACMLAAGAREGDARIVADVLRAADLRGKESHGIARLRRYADGIKSGKINGAAETETMIDVPAIAVLDAHNGLGQPASVMAMNLAVDKAQHVGMAAVAVRHSNHFGIAGYYAHLACTRGMVGFATSNASQQVAPTHGAKPLYGTNPLGIAFPTGGEFPFVLDMATSIAPRGKLERMNWHNEEIPSGWAIDPDGNDITDLPAIIEGLKKQEGHSLLPLGGAAELFSGHKGYGLGLFVDLLCGPLAGAAWGEHVYGDSGANLGHFFMAMNVDLFCPEGDFEAKSKQFIDEVHDAKLAVGSERIFVPGEKAHERTQERQENGIRLPAKVLHDVQRLAQEYNVTL